jgi:hypothetical protein
MAEDTNQRTQATNSGTDQEARPEPGGINPSAPASGTAGWGTTSDEKEVLSPPNAAATRAGQMKGNPGDNMTEASNRASEAATTNKKPEGSSKP